jgi:hypothetical protein
MNVLAKFGIFLLIATPGLALAEDAYTSNFIENLPALQVSSTNSNMLEWSKDGVNGAEYTKLLIPQPYVFLSDENKYDGLQPDQMKLLADRLGAIFSSRFEDIIEIVDEPGSGVIVMNLAATEIVMKKKRGLLGYTPGGALLHAARADSKMEDLEEVANKVQLKGAHLEVEFVDGGTGELLAVRILMIEGKQEGREDESWYALRKEITDLADLFYENYAASLLKLGGS